MKTESLHVVLGSGQIGMLVAEGLLARGERVRVVRRGLAGAAKEGLEWRSGDLADLRFAEQAGQGARVVYDCTSPAYDRWATDLFPISRGALHVAKSSRAKLVVLDNLYMLGTPEGPMREDSPHAPRSKKGELRARLAEERALAHDRGEVRMTTARASDFLGPGVVRQTTFGDRFYKRVFAGKSAECWGDPDTAHSLTYGPDVARAMLTLGGRDEALGKVWHVPTNAPETMRQTVARLSLALGLPIRITRVPRLAFRAIGLVVPLIREVVEMAHQWDVPYVMDDARFRQAFGGEPTPMTTMVEETARWARATYGRSSQSSPGMVSPLLPGDDAQLTPMRARQ